MKKYIFFAAAMIMLAGCAAVAPALKTGWNGVNASDEAALKIGKIELAPAAVLEAAADVLKAEGWQLEKAAGAADSVLTARRHGVTVYGSCDYAMSCSAVAEENSSKLSWSIISYVSPFITNTDPVGYEAQDKWNTAVYKKLAEKGLIKIEPTPVPAAAVSVTGTAEAPAAAGAQPLQDGLLPAPPKEDEVE